MATFSELMDDFVASRAFPMLEGEGTESNSGYKVIGHELHQTIDQGSKATRAIAGWTNLPGIDTMIWIDLHWRGFPRENLELRLKKIPMITMTIMPTEDYDDQGADVIWWAHPVECMSCGEALTDEQRTVGLCVDCRDLRTNHLDLPEHGDGPGIEQRRGLHGDPLPRNRPSKA